MSNNDWKFSFGGIGWRGRTSGGGTSWATGQSERPGTSWKFGRSTPTSTTSGSIPNIANGDYASAIVHPCIKADNIQITNVMLTLLEKRIFFTMLQLKMLINIWRLCGYMLREQANKCFRGYIEAKAFSLLSMGGSFRLIGTFAEPFNLHLGWVGGKVHCYVFLSRAHDNTSRWDLGIQARTEWTTRREIRAL